MGAGSYARFIIGLILSLEVIRSWFFDKQISTFAIGLAVIFIILAAVFFIQKMS